VTPGQALKIIIGDGGVGGPLASDGSDGGDSSIITSTGTVLSFAGGGKGGRAGVSQPPFVCADNPLPAGAGGIGGQGDPAAAIRRAGIDGKPGRQTGAAGCAPCNILSPFAAAGGLSGFAVNGSLAPPGSMGGDGGHGASTSFIGNCTNRPAEMGTAGSPGTKGYILVMW
jgi:hypothetical protein